MKRNLPIACAIFLGLCAGFTLCYLVFVVPHRESPRASVPREEVATLTISRDGSVYLAEQRIDLSQLASRRKQFGGKQPVFIRADSTTDYRRILEVLDACKAGEVSRISLAAARTP